MAANSTVKSTVISFRLSLTESAHIAAAAQENGRQPGDWVRAKALAAAGATVPPPAKPIRNPARRLPALDTQLLAKILGQLGHVATRLDEVAQIVTEGGSRPPPRVLAAVETDVIEVRNAVRMLLAGGSEQEHAA
jgi:hypothetical protein